MFTLRDAFIHQSLRAGILAVLFTAPVLSYSQAPGYEPPRTEFGVPDLQGVWSNRSITRMERPAGVDSLVLTQDEARVLARNNIWIALDAEQQSNPVTDAEPGEAEFGTRGHNAFWVDAGTGLGVVKGEIRSSWVTNPANGKIPYKEGGAALRTSPDLPPIGSFDGPETRPVHERCLAFGYAIGPVMANGIYNNNYRIVQTEDYVMFMAEMGHEVRIIPFHSEHRPEVWEPWFGSSIAWYEGDTLVVETINTKPLQSSFITKTGKVTERYTRWSEDQIFYEFQVEDPSIYTQTWGGEIPFNRESNTYEYACHEGNYSFPGILGGARRADLDAQLEGQN